MKKSLISGMLGLLAFGAKVEMGQKKAPTS